MAQEFDDSGMTPEVAEAYARLLKRYPRILPQLSGIRVNPALQDYELDGQYTDDGYIEVNPRVTDPKSLERLLLHELAHAGGADEGGAALSAHGWTALDLGMGRAPETIIPQRISGDVSPGAPLGGGGFMAGLKEFLLTQGPKLAMAFMAAKQGGPQASAALMQGWQQAAMRRQQLGVRQQELDRQMRLDQRQTQLDQQAEEDRAFRRSDVNADNARADLQFKQQQFQQALALIDKASAFQAENAVDPTQAENAVMQQAQSAAQMYGLPPDQLTGFVPNLSPKLLARKKREAQALYERAEKRYNPKGQHPEWETSITLKTEAFGDVTPATLREMYQAPAVTQTGEPAVPPAVDPEAASMGSFDAHFADVLATEEATRGAPLGRAERAALRVRAKKEYDATNDKPVDPSVAAMRDLQMQLAQLSIDEAKRRQPLKDMPAEYQTALNRAIMSIPAVRRGSVVQTVNELWLAGKTEEVKDVIRQAAIESEPVDMKNQIMGREATLALVKDVKDKLLDLQRRGVPTNWFVGTVEDLARRLGTSTNPEYAALSNELMGTLINYRRAATGVQFSQRESADYQRMFPNYRNTLPVNLALLDGLTRQMEVHDRTYWTHKLGAGWAALGETGTAPPSHEPESDPLGLFK